EDALPDGTRRTSKISYEDAVLDGKRRPILIDFHTEIGYGIPVELFPLFGYKPPDEISGRESLDKVARSFLGFSAMIRRFIPTAHLQNARRLVRDPLAIKYFRDRGLTAAEYEEKLFNENSVIALNGPWPDNNSLAREAFIKEIANYIWNPSRGFSTGKH